MALSPLIEKRGFIQNSSIFLSTGFYAGYFPYIPGTAGTLVGVIIYILLKNIGEIAYITGSSFFILIGIITIHISLKHFEFVDPSEIVIDEIAGFLITMFMIPKQFYTVLIGFILFRIFDILKPVPINKLENLPDAWGVMMDDIGAGIYANILLQFYIRIQNIT
ncbi:phosphatidylglycerophosphatase A [Candidatus Poribacteria bacterium]|nr:phosphatidylglycerophosphatase A [Candidatus Poribacteria bacterium]